jgi:hypothetical protein
MMAYVLKYGSIAASTRDIPIQLNTRHPLSKPGCHNERSAKAFDTISTVIYGSNNPAGYGRAVLESFGPSSPKQLCLCCLFMICLISKRLRDWKVPCYVQ